MPGTCIIDFSNKRKKTHGARKDNNRNGQWSYRDR